MKNDTMSQAHAATKQAILDGDTRAYRAIFSEMMKVVRNESTVSVTEESKTVNTDQKQVITQVANVVARKMLNRGLTLMQGYALGGAVAGCLYMEDHDDFADMVETYIQSAKVNGTVVGVDLTLDHAVQAGLINSDNNVTEGFMSFWEELACNVGYPHIGGIDNDKRVKKYRTDKRGRNDNNPEVLAALDACESTLYTVDEQMLVLAKELCLPADRYVVNGCLHSVALGNQPSASEFATDDRGRMYHSSCHGANGQAGDMQRALMNLHGRRLADGTVKTIHNNYDIDKAIKVLLAEMEDMI
jgi:hypothetical protein